MPSCHCIQSCNLTLLGCTPLSMVFRSLTFLLLSAGGLVLGRETCPAHSCFEGETPYRGQARLAGTARCRDWHALWTASLELELLLNVG